MSHCCVISCLNNRLDGKFRFFSFPLDPILCSIWVEFCHCPETSKRFARGGPRALRKFGICSEHFDPSAVEAVSSCRVSSLKAIPVNIGKTHMTPKKLKELGFNCDAHVIEENEEGPKPSEFPDEVIVEMLSPEELEAEMIRDEKETEDRDWSS